MPRGGMLIVTEDETELSRNYTYSTRDPIDVIYGTNREVGTDTPILWINEATANRILQGSNQTIADLRLSADDLIENELINFPTPHIVSMAVEGTLVEKTPAQHVIGYLPGTAGTPGETQLDNKMIVVMAQYDAPPIGPDGVIRAGANDNASGVAVMFEAIRTLQESGYQPYKTFLFVAYSGEGLEGGELVTVPDPQKFLQAKTGFASTYDIEAVVDLRGLGAGNGDRLAISAGGSQRLSRLFEEAAGLNKVDITRIDDSVDFRLVFEDRNAQQGGQEAPRISLSWEGWHETSRTPDDTIETISEDKLDAAGETLSLALMILGRETEY